MLKVSLETLATHFPKKTWPSSTESLDGGINKIKVQFSYLTHLDIICSNLCSIWNIAAFGNQSSYSQMIRVPKSPGHRNAALDI